MVVYVVFEHYWHDIDGSWKDLSKIFSNIKSAHIYCKEMNESEGYILPYHSKEFTVEEWEVFE